MEKRGLFLEILILVSALLLTYYVNLRKSINISEPWFHHFLNEGILGALKNASSHQIWFRLFGRFSFCVWDYY